MNRSERLEGDQQQTELGRIRLPEGGKERRSGSSRPDVKAGETVLRGVLA